MSIKTKYVKNSRITNNSSDSSETTTKKKPINDSKFQVLVIASLIKIED